MSLSITESNANRCREYCTTEHHDLEACLVGEEDCHLTFLRCRKHAAGDDEKLAQCKTDREECERKNVATHCRGG